MPAGMLTSDLIIQAMAETDITQIKIKLSASVKIMSTHLRMLKLEISSILFDKNDKD